MNPGSGDDEIAIPGEDQVVVPGGGRVGLPALETEARFQ